VAASFQLAGMSKNRQAENLPPQFIMLDYLKEDLLLAWNFVPYNNVQDGSKTAKFDGGPGSCRK
jgi:hypothetical protein